jgi:hypothetical protein
MEELHLVFYLESIFSGGARHVRSCNENQVISSSASAVLKAQTRQLTFHGYPWIPASAGMTKLMEHL